MESKLNRITSIGIDVSLLLLFAFPILPLPITNIIFICFTFFLILYWILNKRPPIWKWYKRNLIFCIPFIPYLIEYCFYIHNPVAGFEMGKKLLFFIAPLSFAFYCASGKSIDLRVYCWAFTIAILLLSSYSLILLIHNNILFDPASYAGDSSILRSKFEDITKLHPTYFGFFASISFFWILFNFKNLNKTLKLVIVLASIILLFIDFVVAAKMSIIILILGTLFISYKLISQKKNILIIYSLITVLLVVLIFLIPSLQERTFEMKDIFSFQDLVYNSVNERKIIFITSWEIFIRNIWLGIGSRNMQNYLDACYWTVHYYPAFIKNYNSHNQFLTLGINYGIFDVFLFLSSILLVLREQWKNIFAIVLIASTIMIMLTESILERQMGVYFFVLFMIVLINIKRQEDGTTEANEIAASH